MNWLARALVGPGLWAAGFAAVYALHGLGCAQGWPTSEAGAVLHRLAMGGVGIGALVACLLLFLCLPAGPDLARCLPRAGAAIGFGATAFTLLPLTLASGC